MSNYLITCRSLTHAQKCSTLLERSGISASVVKAPQELSGRGCSYALALNTSIDNAVSILKNHNMLNGRVFVLKNGKYTEVQK